MADKHSHLNGAYYGPAIPPPTKSYYRAGRGSSCGPCGCLKCCGCCLFKCVFQIILTIALVIGIIALIIWLIFRPNAIKFNVTDAHLTQFNLTNNNMLHYNLAVNISVRNPNKKIGVYYDHIEARAYYEGERFDSVMLPSFYQGHKNTSFLHPAFDGQRLVVLGNGKVGDFNDDKAAGLFDIDLKLYLRVRFKMGIIRTPRLKPKIRCDIRVPLKGHGGSAATFEPKSCNLDF